jgi:hypothetical protein
MSTHEKAVLKIVRDRILQTITGKPWDNYPVAGILFSFGISEKIRIAAPGSADLQIPGRSERESEYNRKVKVQRLCRQLCGC